MPSPLSLPLLPTEESRPTVPLYEGDLAHDLCAVARNKLAEKITGGLSQTSKLPCPSWGIPATRCRVGSILVQEHGTVCNHCYALRGRYVFEAVQRKLQQRFNGLFDPRWTPSMIFLINYFCNSYFRWFDSGDVQGVNHLRNIRTVAQHTPQVRHWLPTREMETVRSVQKEYGDPPENLVIRVSAHRIDGAPPRGFSTTSTVTATRPRKGTYVCPAPEQKNTCRECRACWNEDVSTVTYWLH